MNDPCKGTHGRRRVLTVSKVRKKYTFEGISGDSSDSDIQQYIESQRKEFYKEWWPYIAQYSDDDNF